jgi:hypothetical protein
MRGSGAVRRIWMEASSATHHALKLFSHVSFFLVKWNKNECYMPKMIGARQYDPLDPVKCFQSHFKCLNHVTMKTRLRVRVGVENQAL